MKKTMLLPETGPERGTKILPSSETETSDRDAQRKRYVTHALQKRFGAHADLVAVVRRERTQPKPSAVWGDRKGVSRKEILNSGLIFGIPTKGKKVRDVVRFLRAVNVSLSEGAVRELRGDGTSNRTLFTLLSCENLAFVTRSDASWFVMSADHQEQLWIFEASGRLTPQWDDQEHSDLFEDVLYSLLYIWNYDKTDRAVRARSSLCHQVQQAIEECTKKAEADFDAATFIVESETGFDLYRPTQCITFDDSTLVGEPRSLIFVHATTPAERYVYRRIQETADELLHDMRPRKRFRKPISHLESFVRELRAEKFTQALVETKDGVVLLFTDYKHLDVKKLPAPLKDR